MHYAKEKIPYGAMRYVGETERLYGVLDARLQDRDWVAGPGRGKYSIADMSLCGWVNGASYLGLDIDQFPNVKAWFQRLWERPATQRGFTVPAAGANGIIAYSKRLSEGDEDLKKQFETTKKFIDDSKKQYNYKYSSP